MQAAVMHSEIFKLCHISTLNAGLREDGEVILWAQSGEILNSLVFHADQVLFSWKQTNQSHHFSLN